MANKKPGEGSKKGGRKVRVDLRRNRGKAVRDKAAWTRHERQDNIQSEDAEKVEAVRGKGAISRKRTIIVPADTEFPSGLHSGIVIAVRGLVANVDDGERIWACTVRRLLRTRLITERHPITVGDAVGFLPVEIAGEQGHFVSEGEEQPEGVIEHVVERKTTLVRHYDRKVHAVAANIDNVVIVVAAEQPPLRPHLIDRYLVAAHMGKMRPIVCINKADLDSDGTAQIVADRYARIGYQTVLTSTIDSRGIETLRRSLQNQTSVLVGPSGVGKSSLLNTLDSALELRVGTISDLQRGRHTTTTARLLRWAFGGYVVDTPGMRQFDLAEVDAEELEAYFIEFVDLVQHCRFEDCSHTHEIECAVKAAVEEGRIDVERYDSYCKMYEECREKREY